MRANVKKGESVVIAQHGEAMAELIASRETGFPLGIARQDPPVPRGDDWWQAMTDEEVDHWIDGQ